MGGHATVYWGGIGAETGSSLPKVTAQVLGIGSRPCAALWGSPRAARRAPSFHSCEKQGVRERPAPGPERLPAPGLSEGWKPPVPPARPPPYGLRPNGAPSEGHPHPHRETGEQTARPGETPAQVGVRHSLAAGASAFPSAEWENAGPPLAKERERGCPAAALTCSEQRPRGDPVPAPPLSPAAAANSRLQAGRAHPAGRFRPPT